MAHTLSSQMVKLGQPVQNIDSSGNVETRGMFVCGEVDITSYTSSGEILNAAELGLNVIYNAQFQMEETDAYAVRSADVASGGKSLTLHIDTAGTGTEVSGSTDVGRVSFQAWGEDLGSGSN